MATAAMPLPSIPARVANSRTAARVKPVFAGSLGWMPRACMANRLLKIPIMKISEWAKLIRRSTPYTSV